jgi:hypothetical protein
VSLGRIVNSLLQHATHKNTAYRSKVALLADHLVDRHGTSVSDRCASAKGRAPVCSALADRFMTLPSHIRDLERIFHAAAAGFSCDSAQETRNSGKRLLVALHPLLRVGERLVGFH